MIRKSIANKDAIARQHHLINRVVADKRFLLYSAWSIAALKDISHLNFECCLPSCGMAFERMAGAASLVDQAVVEFQAEARLVGNQLDAGDFVGAVRAGDALS